MVVAAAVAAAVAIVVMRVLLFGHVNDGSAAGKDAAVQADNHAIHRRCRGESHPDDGGCTCGSRRRLQPLGRLLRALVEQRLKCAHTQTDGFDSKRK